MATLDDVRAELQRRQAGAQNQAATASDVQAEIARRQQPQGAVASIDEALLQVPGVAQLGEFMAGANRAATGLADFLTTDQINAVLEIAGSEQRVPSIGGAVEGATTGGFVEPGLQRDILSSAGEVSTAAIAPQQALRFATAQIPRLAPQAPTVTQGVIQTLAADTAPQAAKIGAISGAGAEVGEEFGGTPGAIAGSILAPVGAGAIGGIKDLTVDSLRALTQTTSRMSDDGAAKVLATAMVREGVGPDEAAARLAQLGPDAVPADIGGAFSRQLKAAANMVPTVEGRAKDILDERQMTSGQRILSALDDSTGTSGLSVDDEAIRLNDLLKPQIDELYSSARSADFGISPNVSRISMTTDKSKAPKLRRLLDNPPAPLQSAMRKANVEIDTAEKLGESFNDLARIDAIKRALDDQIGSAVRKGENHKASLSVRVKNRVIEEADKAIPEYKEARSLFAGKKALEDAADLGRNFMKLKPREVQEFTRSMGDSERRFFLLGAKENILDSIDKTDRMADLSKRLFGKSGSIKMLRPLFDSQKGFKQFDDTLKRESDFAMTRRAAQGGSSTAKQIVDVDATEEALNAARQAIMDPVGGAGAVGGVLKGLKAKKDEQAFLDAIEKAGDILLESGMNPEKLASLLRSGNRDNIARAVKAAQRKQQRTSLPAVTTGATLAGSQDTERQ